MFPVAKDTNLLTYFKATKVLMEAHVRAYSAIKKVRPTAQVGIVLNINQFDNYPDWTQFLSTPVTSFFNHI